MDKQTLEELNYASPKVSNEVKKYYLMFPKYGNVLDIGCGKGMNASFLTDKGYNVTAFDYNENLLPILSDIFPSAIICDVSDFYFQENKYDIVLLLLVMHQVPTVKQENLIKDISNCIKDNGLFLFSMKFNSHREIEDTMKFELIKKLFAENFTVVDKTFYQDKIAILYRRKVRK